MDHHLAEVEAATEVDGVDSRAIRGLSVEGEVRPLREAGEDSKQRSILKIEDRINSESNLLHGNMRKN